ncbi:hypothetical protein HMSSN139_14040 [Paenibacillus sp. HMSSN-139]|nr:hypothetical protein HMSSN139_14040 [Paenibacillus sp. HMSSN-139]
MKEKVVLHHLKRVNGEEIDIVIEDGKIAEITGAGQARGDQEWDASSLYVSSGWIDMHVHAFPEFDPYGDEIDEIGVKQASRRSWTPAAAVQTGSATWWRAANRPPPTCWRS